MRYFTAKRLLSLFPQLYVVGVLTFFLSRADSMFYDRSLIKLSPIRAFLVLFAPMIFLLIIREAARRNPFGETLRLLTANWHSVLAFFAVPALALLYCFHPGAKLLADGYLMKARYYEMLVFAFGLLLPIFPLVRRSYHAIFALPLLLLLATIIQDLIVPGTFSDTSRAAGLAGNPNAASFILCLLTGAALTYEYRRRMRDVALLCFCGIGCFATLSRSGLLTFVLLVALYLYFTMFRTRGLGRKALLTLGLVGFLGVLASLIPSLVESSGMFSGRVARTRLAILLGERAFVESNDGRVGALWHALQLINEGPIVGYGTGFSAYMPVAPHNMYLHQWVNNGLLGLLVYLLFLFSLFSTFYCRRFLPGQVIVALCAFGSLFSHNIFEMRPFLLTCGILLSFSYYRKLTTAVTTYITVYPEPAVRPPVGAVPQMPPIRYSSAER